MIVKQLIQKKKLHREIIALEKQGYYKARIKGRTFKMVAGVKVRRHMSIILDGMDQGKTAYPSPARMDKKLDACTTLTTHVVGALDHGGSSPAQLYVSDPSIPHDANGVITILVRVIKRAAETDGRLPLTLYIQLDGAGENKCKMMLLFLAILVGLGVFMKIKLSFLPVGHTHEDIDQLFSRLSVYLQKRDILTLQELLAAIRSAAKFEGQPPFVSSLTRIFDFKGWMADLMPKPFKGVTAPMSFKFVLSDDKTTVRMFARDQMRESKVTDPGCWFPEGGYRMLSVEDAVALADTPLLVVPPRPIDTAPLRSTVAEYRKWDAMSVAQETMWEVELEKMDALAEDLCGTCSDLRMREVHTNTVKTDTKAEKNVKKNKRSAIHKELAQHLETVTSQAVPPLGHEFVSVRTLLGSAIPVQGERKVQAPPVLPNPVVSEDEDNGGRQRRKKKDARALVVGKVPVHMRVVMSPVDLNDIICFRYTQKEGRQEDAEERTNMLGVACVQELPTPEKPDTFKIHWYGNGKANGSSNSLTVPFRPMWVQPGGQGKTKTKKKNGKNKRKAADPSTRREQRYYAEKAQHGTHYARSQVITITKHMMLYQMQALNKGGILPVKAKRYLCAAEQMPHKLPSHGDNCDCISAD